MDGEWMKGKSGVYGVEKLAAGHVSNMLRKAEEQEEECGGEEEGNEQDEDETVPVMIILAPVSMVSNHPDHDPPSRPDATPVLSHRPPPPTRTHHETPPRSWSTARAQCQRDTVSATSTTISPHDSESATLDPTPRPPVRDPQTAIHGAVTEALDLRDTCCGILDHL
ncbi:unnamed protein product [Pleuronectes platessa]|uniref:Uncharacterized protein n=1 Tax=Pleuronectes platessa TaxID=8262 RepID=A0A9N7VSH4_PLEPL|nr:unnamed protein product [Pleuronectes platessa]